LLSIFLSFSAMMLAQSTLTLTGPATAKQGSTITLSLNSAGVTASGPVGVQWTLTPPSGFTVTLANAGVASVAASKQIACNAAKLLCLIYGLNQNVIADGQVASLIIPIPVSATPGPASFALSGLFAGDKTGASMTITSGPTYSIIVLSRADINGDGIIDPTDVALMVGQVKENSCVDDPNGDGACNLFDVLYVINRALGL